MPRAAGQIDRQKNQAILDATAVVMNERGLAAPIETIAKLAGVSKQTIYNHYGSKSELLRALMSKRVVGVSRSIDGGAGPGDVEEDLVRFAVEMLHPTLRDDTVSLIRVLVLAGEGLADLSNDAYEAGPGAALVLTSRYLAAADKARQLDVDDPELAAEMFIGMVMGQRHLRHMLRLPPILRPEDVEDVARETVRRFMRAFAPAPAA